MAITRREFVENALAVAAVTSLCPLSCRSPKGNGKSVQGKTLAAPQAVDNSKENGDQPRYLALEKSGELKRREDALWDIFKSCRLCPRACGVNRLAGEKGQCGATAEVKVHSAGPHFGEEWPLVGTSGSGTVFFSSCNLLCCFCQNWEINHRGDGKIRTHQSLARMMLDLQSRGCKNINLVTPTHVAPNIVKALRIAISGGLKVPLVYNTGGYDSLDVIRLLDGIVDIYLPDFKYQDEQMALKYSSNAAGYPKAAAAGIKEMYRQVGNLKSAGLMGTAVRGLMLRHLVMPNNIAGTDRFIQWVAKELSLETYTNLMDQYHPAHKAFDYPKIARRITAQEWQQVRAWAKQAGLKRVEG